LFRAQYKETDDRIKAMRPVDQAALWRVRWSSILAPLRSCAARAERNMSF